MSNPLLIELLVEEIPPQLTNLAHDFSTNLANQLINARFLAQQPTTSYCAQTPRRLTTIIDKVRSASLGSTRLRRGPARSRAFTDDREPTAALTGFLRSNNADIDDLIDIEHNQIAYVAVETTIAARKLEELLGELIEKALTGLVAPRLMRWGDSRLRFVRPLHGICALLGNRPLTFSVANIPATATTVGHRFLAPGPIQIASANQDEYVAAMEKNYVMVSVQQRKKTIRDQCDELAHKCGGDIDDDDDLVAQIAAMCEWPVSHLGTFTTAEKEPADDLPHEVITSCMKKHLRCLPILKDGLHTRRFVFVADNKFADSGKHILGIERVMRARLDDAIFCWKQDRKFSDKQHLARLDNITYLKNLGSVTHRVERIKLLVKEFTRWIELTHSQFEDVACAARMCKAAQGTLLANEYPELEGVLASYYLRDINSKVTELLANYLDRAKDHTDPDAGDTRDRDCLVLAHEIERIAAIVAIHEGFSGSKDPFGLRRSMLRVLRVLERYPGVDYAKLLFVASKIIYDYLNVKTSHKITSDDLNHKLNLNFQQLLDRVHLLAGEWLNAATPSAEITRIVDAVIYRVRDQKQDIDISDIKRRVLALAELRDTNHAGYQMLLAANKRLAKIYGSIVFYDEPINKNLVIDPAELQLVAKCDKMRLNTSSPANYFLLLEQQIELCPDINTFFDQVLINDPDPAIRANRHALLRNLLYYFNLIATMEKLYS